MRKVALAAFVAVVSLLAAGTAHAGDDEKRVINGVLSGLIGGQPQQAPDAAYLAKERERLVGMLQSGQYATSRQGESVDVMILGIPLTKAERVYTARPIPPSQASQ